MYFLTRSELEDLVRTYADAANATVRFPPAELYKMLDIGLQIYWGIVCGAGNLAAVASATINATSLTNSYSLPADVFRIISVEKLNGTKRKALYRGEWFDASRIGIRGERYIYSAGSSSPMIEICRRNMQSDTYIVRYIAGLPRMSLSDDFSIPFVNGWEELPCLEAAVRLLVKDREDDSGLMALLARAHARVPAEVNQTDIYQRVTKDGLPASGDMLADGTGME